MTPMTDEALELSRELAMELGQAPAIRREGDSFFITSETDKTEQEHRVDLLAGRLYCTCQGFLHWKHCKHVDQVRREMNENHITTEVTTVAPSMPALARQNPAALAVRLADMKENRRLTREFFQSVMEEGVDYGVIPGTDKPTLYKPGAEGLCEFYGYAPTYNYTETKDIESGFLRVVVTCTLVQRGSGEIVAQGLGECNTREARYFYRWMPEWELKKYPDLWDVRSSMKKEHRTWGPKGNRKGGEADFYRIENDDLHTLWNTVLKMAKKRAHVDATLSATRSSGLFSQGQAALEDWLEGEVVSVSETPIPTHGDQQEPHAAEAASDRAASAPAPPPAHEDRQEAEASPRNAAATGAPSAPPAASPTPVPPAVPGLLGAIQERHGLPAKQAAINVMTRLYGTGVVTRLSVDEYSDYASILSVRLNGCPGHEMRYTANGVAICGHCGDEMDEAAPFPGI